MLVKAERQTTSPSTLRSAKRGKGRNGERTAPQRWPGALKGGLLSSSARLLGQSVPEERRSCACWTWTTVSVCPIHSVLSTSTHSVLSTSTHSVLSTSTHSVLSTSIHSVLSTSIHSLLSTSTHSVLSTTLCLFNSLLKRYLGAWTILSPPFCHPTAFTQGLYTVWSLTDIYLSDVLILRGGERRIGWQKAGALKSKSSSGPEKPAQRSLLTLFPSPALLKKMLSFVRGNLGGRKRASIILYWRIKFRRHSRFRQQTKNLLFLVCLPHLSSWPRFCGDPRWLRWERTHLLMQKARVLSLRQEDPLERKWQPAPGFLPGEFHGQRNLAGLWGPKESDTTEQLNNMWKCLQAPGAVDRAMPRGWSRMGRNSKSND